MASAPTSKGKAARKSSSGTSSAQKTQTKAPRARAEAAQSKNTEPRAPATRARTEAPAPATRARTGHAKRELQPPAPKRKPPPPAPTEPATPKQGYEPEEELELGHAVNPPSGTELVESLADIVGELAGAGLTAGGRLLKDAFSILRRP